MINKASQEDRARSCQGIEELLGIAERASVLDRNNQNRAIPTPRFARKFSTWNPPSHAGFYLKIVRSVAQESKFRVAFDKFFPCRKTNFRTEVCSCSGYPTTAMVAKSLDDLMKSQSIGGYVFPMFEMLDAKIATALKRIISNQYFRRSINVE